MKTFADRARHQEPEHRHEEHSFFDQLPVGEVLRAVREQHGISLDDVALRLRIRPPYLEAIEAGRPQDLPGSVYAYGFVRSYADYLGLDAEQMVRRFRAELGRATQPVQLNFPTVAREGHFPGGAVLVLSSLLALVAYGGWYLLSDRQQSPLDQVPEVPARLLQTETPGENVTEVPATSAVAATTAGGASDTVDAADSGATASDAGQDLSAAAPENAEPASGSAALFGPAAAEPASEPIAPLPAVALALAEVGDTAAAQPPLPFGVTGEVFGAENQGSRILLNATMESWVRVSDARDQPVWTRVLRSGQSYLVPNQPGLTLTTGNAGGLAVFVDGKKLPQLGPIGVVRRGISLEPDRLLSGATFGQ